MYMYVYLWNLIYVKVGERMLSYVDVAFESVDVDVAFHLLYDYFSIPYVVNMA